MLNRTLRSLGLHVEKHRDAFTDFASFAPDAECVVDGGAYKGAASKAFLRLFPKATIHAFEPNPELTSAINATTRDGRVEVHAVALSETRGLAKLHIPDKAFTASLLTPDASFGATKSVTVMTMPLNDLGILPDAIKLDLQGNELSALRGASKKLPHTRAVLCEVNFVARYEYCALFHEVAALLGDYGLQFHRLYEVHANKSGAWQFADALFVRR